MKKIKDLYVKLNIYLYLKMEGIREWIQKQTKN